MNVGFFTVFRTDPQHQLHATLLAAEAHRVMPMATVCLPDGQFSRPAVDVVQLTDDVTPIVAGVDRVTRRPKGPMLERRLEHYAACQGDWLLVDTDVSLRADVRGVFDDRAFDVALVDRDWPHLPQRTTTLQTMPFNTGVMFSRCPQFWADVLATWLGLPESDRDWLSEQRAVATVVRTGRYRVKVLPGLVYNYPPQSESDPCDGAAMVHFKGPKRKTWLSARCYRQLTEAACA